MNEELPESAGYKLASNTFLPFVHTAYRMTFIPMPLQSLVLNNYYQWKKFKTEYWKIGPKTLSIGKQ